MQAQKKSNSVATSTFDSAIGLLAIAVLGAGSLTFDVRKFVGEVGYDGLNENGKRALGHGMNQRLMDKAAIGRDAKTGKSATAQEKFDAILALAKHYEQGGEWAMKGGGPRPIDRTSLYLAVAEVRGVDVTKVEAVYRSKEDSVIRTLLTIPAIAAKYAELTAKGSSEQADDLLGELDALEE